MRCGVRVRVYASGKCVDTDSGKCVVALGLGLGSMLVVSALTQIVVSALTQTVVSPFFGQIVACIGMAMLMCMCIYIYVWS